MTDRLPAVDLAPLAVRGPAPAAGMVVPALVQARAARELFLLAQGRELPVPAQGVASLAAGEQVALVVRESVRGGMTGQLHPLRTPAELDTLLRDLGFTRNETARVALRLLLQEGAPFTAATLRARLPDRPAPAAAAPPPAATLDTLLAHLALPPRAQFRAALQQALTAGLPLDAGTVQALLQETVPPLPAGRADTAALDALLVRLGQAPGEPQRLLLRLLLAQGVTVRAELLSTLLARAQQWQVQDTAGWRALAWQQAAGMPPSRAVWTALRAGLLLVPRQLTAAAAQVPWRATAADFTPAYWSRLGLTTEAHLASGQEVARDNLRSVMLSSPNIMGGAVPEALAGKALLSAEQGGQTVVPLLFTDPVPVAGTLVVHDGGRRRRRRRRRPHLALALEFSALGAVGIRAEPEGTGYRFTLQGTDAGVTAHLAAALDGLQQTLAACGAFTVAVGAPPAAPAASGETVPAAGMDVRA